MSAKSRPCEICMAPIDQERLEAVPETRLCATHARQIQKYGGEFTITVTPERTSKAGSLKHNYGGVITDRTRNLDAMRKLRDEFENE